MTPRAATRTWMLIIFSVMLHFWVFLYSISKRIFWINLWILNFKTDTVYILLIISINTLFMSCSTKRQPSKSSFPSTRVPEALHRWTVIFTSMFDTVKLFLNAKFQQCSHPCCCPVIIYWRHTLEQLLQHHDPQWKKMLSKAFPATKGSSCQCDLFGPVHCSHQHVQVRW